jgi:ribosome-associated toxin RatA of RatAB toxin-antitoxin module
MQLLDGPFERLEGSWHFDPLGDTGLGPHHTQPEAGGQDAGLQGTKVMLRLDYQMKSGLLARLFSPAFDIIAAQMMDAFLTRADQCYGK